MNCKNALPVTLCMGDRESSCSCVGDCSCGNSGGGSQPQITLTDEINLDRSDIAASAKAVKTAVEKAKLELDTHNADANAHGGIGGGSGSDVDISQFFDFGDINFFNRKTPPKGYVVANGTVIEHADTLYPKMWAFLQEADNAWRVKTEEEWQALVHEDGVGGVNAFVLDSVAKTMRLPDVRGDYMAGAGWNDKQVGDSDGDAARKIIGQVSPKYNDPGVTASGAFTAIGWKHTAHDNPGPLTDYTGWKLDSSITTPTDTRNHPATIYMLPCVYIGNPVAQNPVTQ